MKKTFQTLRSLLLILLAVACLAAPVLAAASTITYEGADTGFDFQPGSDYTATDLFQNFKNVMPGDVLTEEITFRNAATDSDFVNLYLRAVPHDEAANPLSESVAASETVATAREFLSKLSMKVWNGETLIFDAAPEEAGGLQENRLLGTFRSGETANLRVELTVPAELDNTYANRIGEVDWVFHLEAFQESQLTARKLWSDGNANHTGDTITVNLLRDGKIAETQELSAANGWAYTFDRLVEGHTWTVEEASVPAGYTVSYATEGNVTTITNTKDTPPTPTPGTPVTITVEKRWSNDKPASRPSSVSVTLYNGKAAYQTVQLSAANNWRYTWQKLAADGNWQVLETNIPRGYTPSYQAANGTVTITNTATLIQTGQPIAPILLCGGLGLLLLILGAFLLFARRKRRDAEN